MSEQPGLFEKLSARERAVFHALIAGHAPPQIARDTGRSQKTIRTQKARVFLKLRVETAQELIAYARRLGLDGGRP